MSEGHRSSLGFSSSLVRDPVGQRNFSYEKTAGDPLNKSTSENTREIAIGLRRVCNFESSMRLEKGSGCYNFQIFATNAVVDHLSISY